MSTKEDLTKTYKNYYTAKPIPAIVNLAPAQYISIVGKGDPSGDDFAASIEALYSTAYTIKFVCKEKEKDFTVAKLEGQWWYDELKFPDLGIEDAPGKIPRSEWDYRLLIRMPEDVQKEMIANAIDKAYAKKGLSLIKSINHFEIGATRAVQVMHVGPYNNEPQTLLRIKQFMDEQNLERNGLHHEIYLSDFRKTPPEKLKTILREPIK